MPDRRHHRIKLPPLPFGRSRAVTFQDPGQLSEQLARSGGPAFEYTKLQKDRPFGSAAAVLRTETTRFIASTMLEARFNCRHDGRGSNGLFLIPLQGDTVTNCDQRRIEWAAGRSALFMPPLGCHGESSARAVIAIDIEPERVEALARTMMAGEVAGRRTRLVDLSTPRPAPMTVGAVRFDQIFQHYGIMLDAMGDNSTTVERSGLADMMLRSVVMMLAPDLFFDSASKPQRAPARLDDVCGYIDAHLDRKITLTDLEAFSGLSARGLQYAFRAKFGCSPMQWVTERRLDAVRRLILAAERGSTLSSIATPFFGNMGDFSRQYRLRFGENPSATLRRTR